MCFMGYKADVLYESGCLIASKIWRKPEVGTSSLIPAPRARNTGAISFWAGSTDCACPARHHRFITSGGGRTASPCRTVQSSNHEESVCIHSQTRPAGSFYHRASYCAPSGERHSVLAHPHASKHRPATPFWLSGCLLMMPKNATGTLFPHRHPMLLKAGTLALPSSADRPELRAGKRGLNAVSMPRGEFNLRPGTSRPAIGRTPKRHCLIANRGPSNPIGTLQSNCCLPTPRNRPGTGFVKRSPLSRSGKLRFGPAED